MTPSWMFSSESHCKRIHSSQLGGVSLAFVSMFALVCVVVHIYIVTERYHTRQFLGMIVAEADGACYYDSSYL